MPTINHDYDDHDEHEDEDDITYNYEGFDYCGRCNGSGEGSYDGSTCPTCKGTGEIAN